MQTDNGGSNWRETAHLELTELQLVISRHEDHAFKVRGFLYAIIGALTTALFLEHPLLTRSAYGRVCAVAVFVFMAMELLHRCYAGRAIDRVRSVESALRGEVAYDGPKIGEALNLTRPLWARQMQLELSYPTLPLHYLFLGALVWAVVEVGT